MIRSGRCNVAGTPGGPTNYAILNTTGFALILGTMEQSQVYNSFNFSLPSSTSNPYTDTVLGNDYPNSTVTGVIIASYLCPSDTMASQVVTTVPGTGGASSFYECNNVARSNHLFVTGNYTDYNCGYTFGNVVPGYRAPFWTDYSTRIADVTDGTSNTMFVGESVQIKQSTSYGPYWGAGTHTAVHGRILDPGPNSGNTALTIQQYSQSNAIPPGTPQLPYAWNFSSKHSGGVNMLFGDGSVHFIKNSINPLTWFALSTIQGGEVLGSDQY